MTNSIHQENNGLADITSAPREHRKRMLKSATASFSHGAITIKCIVRDITSSGAKIKLVQEYIIPDHFSLNVESDNTKTDCEVIWRRGDEIGVKFASPYGEIEGRSRQKVQSSFQNAQIITRK